MSREESANYAVLKERLDWVMNNTREVSDKLDRFISLNERVSALERDNNELKKLLEKRSDKTWSVIVLFLSVLISIATNKILSTEGKSTTFHQRKKEILALPSKTKKLHTLLARNAGPWN